MTPNKELVVRCRAVIIHENKLLVVRHGKDVDFAALPGGHLEWGEEVKECLIREIIEELGVEPVIGRLLYINNFTRDNTQSIEFIFEVTNSSDYVECEKLNRSHASEIFEMCWISPTDTIKVLPTKLANDFKNGTILSDELRYIKNGEETK
ncbi:MAG: NUDIX domain-containing protein [bacterium]